MAIMALLGGCATTATGPGAVASRPLVAALAKTPPLIDGRLDDPAWRRAASTGLFGAPFPPGDASLVGRPEYRTEAKVLWDAEHLYVAFICYAPAIYATMQKHDDRLYEQDVTEVFLDVGTDGAQYAELQVSPKAVTADHFHRWAPPPTFPADKLDWDQASKNHQMEDWDLKGFQAATAPLLVAGQSVGWTVELAIPLGELLSRRGSPARLQRGQVVRANLLRYVWLPGPKPEDQRLHRQLNWSPVMNGCPHVSPMAMRPIRCGR